jgi:hypothetical protein
MHIIGLRGIHGCRGIGFSGGNTMQCPDCHAECLADDLYCRLCGADLTMPSTSLVPTRSNLPAVLSPQLPRLAAGVGALAVGFGLELLRRSLLTRLTRPSRSLADAAGTLPALNGLRDVFFPEGDKTSKLPKGYEIHETVIYLRRVIRHQE